MHRHNTNAAATSAAALAVGFFGVTTHDAMFSLLSKAHQGGVETYEYLADVANVSDEVFQAVYDPENGIPGVWAYEVDEELGAWIAQTFMNTGVLPLADAVRSRCRELGEAMIAQAAE